MNARIQQLEKQSYTEVMHEMGGTYMAFDKEKFAELIVRECLEACSRANEIRHFVPPTQEQVVLSCMREIKQHFGVEE
jgi:histone acetyltransferase (RNA polymerase elongator complex component)